MTALTDWTKRQLDGRPNEANVTRKVIRALKSAGKPVTHTFDGEAREAVDGENDILNHVFNLDECYLLTADGSWVRLVLGNDWDVVCDYTTNLEEILKPVSDYTMARG